MPVVPDCIPVGTEARDDSLRRARSGLRHTGKLSNVPG